MIAHDVCAVSVRQHRHFAKACEAATLAGPDRATFIAGTDRIAFDVRVSRRA